MLALLQDPEIPVQAGSDFGNVTTVHWLGVAVLGALSALTMLTPRRWMALPVILLLCFIPAGQRIVLGTIDLTFLRLLMVAAWCRLVMRRELRPLAWNHLDRAMVVWAATLLVVGTLQSLTLPHLINRLGITIDSMMVYFFFRQLIRNADDLADIATQFLLSGFGVAVFFVIESRTSQNMFYVFGGVPEITEVRDGRLRCQGAFAHAILAGCFWACLVPLYSARGWRGRGWVLPTCGALTSLLVVYLCASSTPVMAVVFGLLGTAAFLIRGALRWVRWLVVAWACVLHFLLMKQPVWHLLARIDLVGGSTGWHRFHLVDKFLEHFPEWWLLGTPTTGQWGAGLQDVTNQFVAEGVCGGVAQLAMFCLCIWFAFCGVSRSLRAPGLPKATKRIAWAIGIALFMHCMNFIAVSYFEQIVVLWQLTLAACASLTLVPGARLERQLGLVPSMAPS